MKFKFEKLIIWQKAIDYGENIFQLSIQFPNEEIYNLTSQIRRAVDSIALNISEGSIGQSNPEYKRFIGFAIRSLAEVLNFALRTSGFGLRTSNPTQTLIKYQIRWTTISMR